jgi:hypothetical protein
MIGASQSLETLAAAVPEPCTTEGAEALVRADFEFSGKGRVQSHALPMEWTARSFLVLFPSATLTA